MNCALDRGDLCKRNFLAHANVLNFLRKYFQVRYQFGQRLFGTHDDVHQSQSREQAVASRRVSIPKDDMTGLLPSQRGSRFQHFFEHILIAHVGAQHADAGVFERDFQTHVRHGGGDDSIGL